jgi:hypothetical protein
MQRKIPIKHTNESVISSDHSILEASPAKVPTEIFNKFLTSPDQPDNRVDMLSDAAREVVLESPKLKKVRRIRKYKQKQDTIEIDSSNFLDTISIQIDL